MTRRLESSGATTSMSYMKVKNMYFLLICLFVCLFVSSTLRLISYHKGKHTSLYWYFHYDNCLCYKNYYQYYMQRNSVAHWSEHYLGSIRNKCNLKQIRNKWNLVGSIFRLKYSWIQATQGKADWSRVSAFDMMIWVTVHQCSCQ